jgi:hypothetical protein
MIPIRDSAAPLDPVLRSFADASYDRHGRAAIGKSNRNPSKKVLGTRNDPAEIHLNISGNPSKIVQNQTQD